MAPDPAALKTKDKGMADGAKPGDAFGSPEAKHAYNADERAAAREAAPVTIGGTAYHRRRKNWEATRGLRGLLRTQERAQTRIQRLRARIDRLGEEHAEQAATNADFDEAAAERALEELEQQVDTAMDEADEAAYGIIALLLKDDDGAQPDLEVLKAELDVEEAGELAANLANGGEPPEGPTPTATT